MVTRKPYVPSKKVLNKIYPTKGLSYKKPDNSRLAMPPGWRKSKATGKWYFENRKNRSDSKDEINDFVKYDGRKVAAKREKLIKQYVRASKKSVKVTRKKPVSKLTGSDDEIELAAEFISDLMKKLDRARDSVIKDAEKCEEKGWMPEAKEMKRRCKLGYNELKKKFKSQTSAKFIINSRLALRSEIDIYQSQCHILGPLGQKPEYQAIDVKLREARRKSDAMKSTPIKTPQTKINSDTPKAKETVSLKAEKAVKPTSLPQLTGTPKQVKWAEDIRADMIRYIMKHHDDLSQEAIDRYNRKTFTLEQATQFIARNDDAYSKFKKTFETKTSAKQYIDARAQHNTTYNRLVYGH